LAGNIHLPLLMTLLDSGSHRLNVKVTAGRGDGISVDAGVSKSIFLLFLIVN